MTTIQHMSRFSDYLQKTFQFSPSEAEEVIIAMKKPLGKSIRINTRKIALEDFKLHAKEQGWNLTDTDIPEVFLIDRDDTSTALGNTLEHMAGWFYIQEVAAAHPPFLLWQEIQKAKSKKQNEGIILDMCAAPGGKTTQLADYFPDALVIANEVNRSRTPQLFDNLDRMGYDNIAVVSCDGRFFQNFPEFFDAVLLDAPCSGEGTAFRDSSVIDHWNEKNIDRIAKLQRQLFETASTVTRPGGFVSYSTCTLNREENDGVIQSLDGGGVQNAKLASVIPELRKGMNEKSGAISGIQSETEINGLDPRVSAMLRPRMTDHQLGSLSVVSDALGTTKSGVNSLKKVFEKRFWPHIEKTGGFFASIFQKLEIAPLSRGVVVDRGVLYPVLAAQGQKNLIVKPATKGEWEIVERFVSKHFGTKLKNGFLYRTKDGVYFNQKNLGPLAEYFYFVHAGRKIGTIKGNLFTPTLHLFWCLIDTSNLPEIHITSEQWSDMQNNKKIQSDREDGYFIGKYGQGVVGIVEVKNSRCTIFGA